MYLIIIVQNVLVHVLIIIVQNVLVLIIINDQCMYAIHHSTHIDLCVVCSVSLLFLLFS
jgi:hypothetical protein